MRQNSAKYNNLRFLGQEGISTSQSGSPATEVVNIYKKSQNNQSTAFSAWEEDPTAVTLATNNCNFIEWFWLSFSRLKKVSQDHKAPQRQKRSKSAKKHQNIPKTAVFAATGDPTVVLSSTNCSTFMRPTSAKKRENNQKYTLFAVMGEPTASCFIGNQLLYFYEVTLSKSFRIQKGTSASQHGSPCLNVAQICQKINNNHKSMHFLLWWGT